MTMKFSAEQIPDKAILDLYGRQAYLANAFSAAVALGSLGGTTEVPYLLFKNPAASGKSAFLYLRSHSILDTAAADAIFTYYSGPTITGNGTGVTPVNLRLNSSSPSSAMSVYKASTVSANGTFLFDVACINSANPTVSNSLMIVDPGVNVLVTCKESSGSSLVSIQVCWYEI